MEILTVGILDHPLGYKNRFIFPIVKKYSKYGKKVNKNVNNIFPSKKTLKFKLGKVFAGKSHMFPKIFSPIPIKRA